MPGDRRLRSQETKPMTDIMLFVLDSGAASEIRGSAAPLEKSLQHLIEQNLEAMLGVFLADYLRETSDDMHSFHADKNDPADRRDQSLQSASRFTGHLNCTGEDVAAAVD